MPQAKLQATEIPAAIGKKVVILQSDGSQKIVTPIATAGNFVLVMHNRSQFYVPTNQPAGTTLFTTE